MTTIRIHFLGGTIGYAGATNGEAVRLGPEALLAGVPGLDGLGATLDVHTADPVPSASLTFEQLSDLAREASQACAEGTADSVVVALGGGHVPAALAGSLGDLAGRMPVVLASRVGAGRVLTGTYRAPGSETDLLGRGLIWSGFLGAAKARILLVTALACGRKQVGPAFAAATGPAAPPRLAHS